jgi:hypothetical protein
MELALDERAGGDAWMTGLGVNLARRISPRQRVGLDLTYQYAAYLEDYAPYEAINNATARERRDDRASVGLSWDWFPAKSWQVHSSVMYRQQFSSIEAFDYDQISGGVNLAYHF